MERPIVENKIAEVLKSHNGDYPFVTGNTMTTVLTLK
jgi:hypothetical protein